MRTIIVALCLAVMAGPALAQDQQAVDPHRLYVTDPKACDLLKKEGVDAFNDLDFTAMSLTDGIQGMEFNCTFYKSMSKSNSTDVLVEAICEEPGFKYPDLISIAPWDENRIQVGSMYDLQQAQMQSATGQATQPEPTDDQAAQSEPSDGQAAGITLYTACKSLKELPR